MRSSDKPAWERFGDAMLDWGGFVLLAIGTATVVLDGKGDAARLAPTLAIVAAAAAWMVVLYTRAPSPRREQHARMRVFFVGLLVFASALMLRHPLFFVFMISGFFYAAIVRPIPIAIVGVGVTSVLINTLIAGVPASSAGWTFYIVIIVVQTLVIGAGVVGSEKVAEQNEVRRVALARLEAAQEENAGLHAQLVSQARAAGVLEERGRMAREIHDTIAQGLTGIITQLEAADQARERRDDRDRYLAHAQRLARESLAEARRSVEASMPGALETGSMSAAIRQVADSWSEVAGIPVDVTVTGEVMDLHPEIQLALLRTAQEALANVGRHAAATRAGLTLSFMGDVVALDVRDDGVGFTVPAPGAPGSAGFGLTAMRQRVARVAGSLVIESEPGVGTAISARVPAIGAAAPEGATS